MRTRMRMTGIGVGATLLIGALASTASAGASVALASGALTPNPGFVANAIDATNPAIGASGSVHLVVNGGGDGKSIVTLHGEGLPASRSFASHLHRDSCASAVGGP